MNQLVPIITKRFGPQGQTSVPGVEIDQLYPFEPGKGFVVTGEQGLVSFDFFIDPVQLPVGDGGLDVGVAEIEPEVIERFGQGRFDPVRAQKLKSLMVFFVVGDDKSALSGRHQLGYTQGKTPEATESSEGAIA